MQSSAPAAPSCALPRAERLLAHEDFRRAQSKGRRLHSTHFIVLLYDRRETTPARLGVTASRKVGNSVVRHRIKRLLREVFRCNKERFPTGHDCVVIAREGMKVPLELVPLREEVLGVLAKYYATKPREKSA